MLRISQGEFQMVKEDTMIIEPYTPSLGVDIDVKDIRPIFKLQLENGTQLTLEATSRNERDIIVLLLRTLCAQFLENS